MTQLLGGDARPVGWVSCFVEAPVETVTDELLSWRRSLGAELEISGPQPYPACLSLLEPLESPWKTELVIECRGSWTAYLNNDRNGGDPTSAAPLIARRLDCRCVVAVHSGRYGPGHGGTQLWVHGPDGTPPLMYERTVSATATDGRWRWETSGQVQPYEKVDRYEARRIRDRFDRELLVQYLGALEIEVDSPEYFLSGRSVRQLISWRTVQESLAEARQRLQIAG